MANIPNQLQLLIAASSVFSLLPLALFLVLAILITILSSLVAIRLIPSTRQVAALAHQNATLLRRVAACKKALNELAEDSDRAHTASAKTSLDVGEPIRQLPSSTPAVESEAESERVQALEARLDFLRDSCKILFAQKNDLLAQQNEDISALKAQLAATHQTKNDSLAQKDEDIASCKTMLAQKTDELASYNMVLSQKNDEIAAFNAQLAATHQAMTTTTHERDEAVARAHTLANELEKTRADYDDKVASLTTGAANATALQTMVQQQKTEIGEILHKNNNLNAELTKVRDLYDSHFEYCRDQKTNYARTIAQQGVEIVPLTKRLEAAPRQRAVPASPRYSFQSFMSRRSSESESDDSFDSDKPSPPRWRQFTIRRARKGGKP
ncbi:hypothetical protein LXA43DRAFT_1063299 [Ganoderma leucocontextum]|nr:hypothetical protein LXA43DRAFT_1063299 [Ganoderma leucocontextum]